MTQCAHPSKCSNCGKDFYEPPAVRLDGTFCQPCHEQKIEQEETLAERCARQILRRPWQVIKNAMIGVGIMLFWFVVFFGFYVAEKGIKQ